MVSGGEGWAVIREVGGGAVVADEWWWAAAAGCPELLFGLVVCHLVLAQRGIDWLPLSSVLLLLKQWPVVEHFGRSHWHVYPERHTVWVPHCHCQSRSQG